MCCIQNTDPLKVFLAIHWRFLLNRLCVVVNMFSIFSSQYIQWVLFFFWSFLLWINIYFQISWKKLNPSWLSFHYRLLFHWLNLKLEKKKPQLYIACWPFRPLAAWTSYFTFIVPFKQSNSDKYTTPYLCLNQFSGFPLFFPYTCLPQWHLIVLNALGSVSAEEREFSNPGFCDWRLHGSQELFWLPFILFNHS